ncbi:MAG: magnesium transporter [Planctomycetaceae bacterium]|jgi:magnesium transporter|nr:magnesium transporter [Planctomycetaceae bacterium]
MPNPLYLPELREMLAENDVAGLREFCGALHPARTVEFMDGLTAEESWNVIRHAEDYLRREIFCFFPEELQVKILESLDREEAAKLIGEMPPDDRVDLLQEMAPELVEEVLSLVPAEERRDIQRLQAYPEDTAGAVMTTEFARVSESTPVKQALDQIARQAEQLETIYYIYVLDDEGHLHGLVSARELLSATRFPDRPVGEIMERDLLTVNVSEDQEEVAAKVAKYDLLAIPVVDDEHRMLGIITHDDVIDVIAEEAVEDAYLAAAVGPLKENYLDASLYELTKKRAIWLTILFFGAIVTAVVIRRYEGILAAIPWLMPFIPLVISTGGNSGNQSAALVITALSTNDITVADWWRVVRREFAMGLLLGGLLAVFGFFCAWSLREVSAFEATVLPITLVLVVVSGTLIGSVLPLLFRRLGLDPALMSNPFVAGIIDVLGIVIYMGVVFALLGHPS